MQGDYEDMLPGLKPAEDGTGIRHRMLLAFEYAETEPDPVEQARLLTFVVVGGGARGVAIAGEIANFANRTLAQELYSIPAEAVRIMVVEAKQRLLAGAAPELSECRRELLQKHGVTVLLGTTVDTVSSDHVIADGERIETRTVIWAVSAEPRVTVAAETSPAPDFAELYRNTVAACARQVTAFSRALFGAAGQTKRA